MDLINTVLYLADTKLKYTYLCGRKKSNVTRKICVKCIFSPMKLYLKLSSIL